MLLDSLTDKPANRIPFAVAGDGFRIGAPNYWSGTGGCPSVTVKIRSMLGRCKAAATEYIAALPKAAGIQEDNRADRVARTFWSADEMQLDPMLILRRDVAKHRRRCVHVVDDHIDATVVEQVTESRPACGKECGKAASSGCCDGLKPGAVYIAK